MKPNHVVSREEWLAARREHLALEKELTHQRETVAVARRKLPWVKIEEDYVFDGPDGQETLADLFAGREQLIVYHFMFGPDWQEGCPSCSFWADNYQGAIVHLAARDTTLVAISRGPLEAIQAYRKRMGWDFKWVSSAGNSFNYDFAVSFPEEQRQGDAPNYNFGTVSFSMEEAPGLSVFARGDDGAVYHTYSTFARGLDPFNGTYQMLDVVPKGRDEDALPFSMAWVRRHDSYE